MANATVSCAPGKGIMWNRFKGNGTEPLNIGWGDATVTASANSNVNLFKPQTEARTAGTSSLATSSFLSDIWTNIGSIVAAGARTITEAALFDTVTLSPTTTLSASLTASATSMTIASTTGWPTSGNHYAQVNGETILVAGSASTTKTITRGRLGSTSAIQAAASPVTIGGDGSNNQAGQGTTEQTSTMGAAQGGNIFAKADFTGIPLATSDSVNFTWSDTLT